MAFRPSARLIEGELDNTHLGKVTGWMRFAGMKEQVTFDLKGDFHRDIRGARIHLVGDAYGTVSSPEAARYMRYFIPRQTGKVGNITAGLPPQDYTKYPYVEWYSEENGRVVVELEPEQITVIGTPIPASECDPISREQQNRNMAEFLGVIAEALDLPSERVVCLGSDTVIHADKRIAHNGVRGAESPVQKIRAWPPHTQENSPVACLRRAAARCDRKGP